MNSKLRLMVLAGSLCGLGLLALAWGAVAEGDGATLAELLEATNWKYRDHGQGLLEVPFENGRSVYVEDGKVFVTLSVLLGYLPERYSPKFLAALLERNHKVFQGKYGLDGRTIWLETALPRRTLDAPGLSNAILILSEEAAGFRGALSPGEELNPLDRSRKYER